MITLIILIKGFLLGWLWAHFEPLQEIISKLKRKLSDKYYLVFYIKTAISCFKCASFWITLILFQDIYAATGASLLAYIFEKKIL